MSNFVINTKSTVIPCLRYSDRPAAIEWLCKALGHEQQAVYPDEDGIITPAQLTI